MTMASRSHVCRAGNRLMKQRLGWWRRKSRDSPVGECLLNAFLSSQLAEIISNAYAGGTLDFLHKEAEASLFGLVSE